MHPGGLKKKKKSNLKKRLQPIHTYSKRERPPTRDSARLQEKEDRKLRHHYLEKSKKTSIQVKKKLLKPPRNMSVPIDSSGDFKRRRAPKGKEKWIRANLRVRAV